MNLAIDYLIRNDLLKSFFKTPCSICLESDSRQIVVSFEMRFSSTPVATHWDLSQLHDEPHDAHLPKYERHYSIKELFDPENTSTVLPGFSLIKYLDEPLQTRYNSYRHPMDDMIFRHYSTHLMNSVAHQSYRREWLWGSFRKLHLGFERENVKRHGYEMSRVRSDYPKKWKIWRDWQRNLLPEPELEVAAELIFLSVYKSKPSLLLPSQKTYTSSSPF